MFRIFRHAAALFACLAIVSPAALAAPQPAAQEAEARKTRVTGLVRDEQNALALPGVPVSLVGSGTVVHTDVDGRYTIDLPPGQHQLKVTMDGYQERTIAVTVGS